MMAVFLSSQYGPSGTVADTLSSTLSPFSRWTGGCVQWKTPPPFGQRHSGENMTDDGAKLNCSSTTIWPLWGSLPILVTVTT